MHRQLSRTPVHLCWSVCGIISWSWSTGQRRCPPRWHNGPSGATCASGSTITVTSTSYFGGAQAAPAGELLVHTRHSTKRPHTISTCFGRSLDCHQVGAPLPHHYLEKLQRLICARINSMHSKRFQRCPRTIVGCSWRRFSPVLCMYWQLACTRYKLSSIRFSYIWRLTCWKTNLLYFGCVWNLHNKNTLNMIIWKGGYLSNYIQIYVWWCVSPNNFTFTACTHDCVLVVLHPLDGHRKQSPKSRHRFGFI